MAGKSLTIKDMIREEKLITTKELAESLGVDIKTIQRTVESLDMNVERKGKSHTMVFTEIQATAIKVELQNHSKIAQNGFTTMTISNDVEMLAISQRLAEYQNRRIAELTALNQTMLPKAEFYDNYCSSENLSEIELLGEKTGVGKKNIFKVLTADKVIQPKFVDGIKFYQAYAQYEKYFKSIPVPFELPDGTKKNRDKLMLTQEGMIHFQKKYAVGE